MVGSIGDVGCFSLQQGKHITSGEGGLVVTNDEDLARRMRLWIDKAWPYGEAGPDHEFVALNSRLTELQGAVALGQLGKLVENVDTRRRNAQRLIDRLEGLPGLRMPLAEPGDVHTYWRFPLLVDPEVVDGGVMGVASDLRDRPGAGTSSRCARRLARREASAGRAALRGDR